MTTVSLRSALQHLPDNASEALVEQCFSPTLLEALGFEIQETHPQYQTGDQRQTVDRAARKTIGNDVFLQTKSNPNLLIEVKGKTCNLSSNSSEYQKTVKQLKKYLLAPNCKTAKWGIITNSRHIQLFRKHGKVIYPATQCLELTEENVDKTISNFRKTIESKVKALTVAIYNNKGGVGKTTTTVNLAAILTLAGKRVLVIDFDHHQKDLTTSLGLPTSNGNIFKVLTERSLEIQSILHPYEFTVRKTGSKIRFDVVTADAELVDELDYKFSQYLQFNRLYQKLESARQEYDYILIDTPPNWRFFSQLAVYAADVVFIPTKHNSLFSLENAALVIKKFIPEVQVKKRNGSPVPLPILFNGEKITDSQREVAYQELDRIIESCDQNQEKNDLRSYFFPRYTNIRKDFHVYEMPNYANISSSAFSRIPAVYQNRFARDQYKNLVKEYFLL